MFFAIKPHGVLKGFLIFELPPLGWSTGFLAIPLTLIFILVFLVAVYVVALVSHGDKDKSKPEGSLIEYMSDFLVKTADDRKALANILDPKFKLYKVDSTGYKEIFL